MSEREQSSAGRVASFYVPAGLGFLGAVSATVILARHGTHAEVGHVLSGRSEIALSAVGRAEAARLAARLAGTPLAAIHSSPRRRARETAQPVADAHGLAVTIADALDEIDFGGWSGRSFQALEEDPAWRHWNASRGSAATPAGETIAAVAERALGYIAGLDLAGGAVLCVSHCDVIRAVIAHVIGLPADRMLAFDVDPASMTTLAVDGGMVRLTSLNERPA